MGSNLGDRRRTLRDAVEALGADVVGVSCVYETDPLGGPEQDRYLNIVVEVATDLSARELLAVCHRLESAAGRVRLVRWGPRTLDVDIVWIEGTTIDEPDLVVPHPRARARRFVLAPWRELAPDLVSEAELNESEGSVEMLGALDADAQPCADGEP